MGKNNLLTNLDHIENNRIDKMIAAAGAPNDKEHKIPRNGSQEHDDE